MSQVSSTAVVHPNVELGEGSRVEDFCIIGCPPRGAAPGELRTVIGAGAVIRSHTVIYAGNVIGARFQTGHKANIRESNRIGDDVSVGTHAVVEHHVEIGSGVRIHTAAFVPEYSRLAEGAWVGPNATLTNARFPAEADTKENLEGPVLEEGARVGANATILPGVRLGRRCLVGAGAVVTHDVPAGAVAVGNPARVVGRVPGA